MKRIGILASILVAATSLVGCDSSKQFAATAGPLARDIAKDLSLDATPGIVSPEITGRATAMAAAAEVGDRTAVAEQWYGNPPVRDAYRAWINAEPKFVGPPGSAGESVRVIKTNSITQFDFILSIGQPKAPAK